MTQVRDSLLFTSRNTQTIILPGDTGQETACLNERTILVSQGRRPIS